MKSFVKGLESETQLLIGVGSAIAAGCIPCLENLYTMAREAGIAEKKIRAAALIGQFVKDQP
ncbi:MAG: carboxymuconolactone decarboxylase family protein, partial [Desulfocapsaceae bacterium]|nr:carboxymuconolactone decarboxylase family protein [Desulfocapsaceae bacterium]